MKKKIIILGVIIMLILAIALGTIVINRTNRNIKPEELSNFSWEAKLFTVNEDYTYTFLCLVTIQDINGIDTVKYEKDGEEVVLNGNGKQKLSIDFSAIENTDYEFKIKPNGEKEKTETLNVQRKVSGKDTYKEVNGIYMNTPFLENFNSKYTRYLSVTEHDTLKPENWIYDAAPEDWYSYKEQKWANIYVEAGGVECYYVWIPRYVYKLNSDTERSDIKFVDVYNRYTDPETKQVTEYKDLVKDGYQLPEAFDFGDGNADNGLLMVSLSGYWISKYQLSELEKFVLDYNMAASRDSIVVSNFTNNIEENKAKKYTYAINGKIKTTETTLSEYTFNGLEENKSYIVNVTALGENDEILGSMTKVLEPTQVNKPKLDGFDPDTTFYVYWDESRIEHNEIPISEDPPPNWYNYTYSEWANIVTRNDGLETYYVWIPRYQYMLNQTSQRSDVKFILGTGTETTEGYQIPEAFWWDKNDDGVEDDGEQLTGYWITKYQLSREESEARITAELAAGTDCIHVKDITGTLLTTTDEEGTITNVPITYTYYLNGEQKHTGTSATDNYTYDNLDLGKEYTVNIIATNTDTKQYIGAITKKVTTQNVNAPDLEHFLSNDTKPEENKKSLKERTYYVVYNDNNEISKYVPISDTEPGNWYDYSKSRWANIVVTDGEVSGNTITNETSKSYFVWVPRYQYKILQSVNDWSNLSTANARTDVKFISGTSNDTSPGYQIPDAFWWDKDDDEEEDEGEQLTGYWISKYQLSN